MVGLFAAVLGGLLAAWARWGKRRRQRLLNTIEVIILPDVTASWLANKLSSFDITLKAGDIVLSGAVAPTLPAVAGDVFTLEMLGQPPLTVMFT